MDHHETPGGRFDRFSLLRKVRFVGVAVRYDDNRDRFYAVMNFTKPR